MHLASYSISLNIFKFFFSYSNSFSLLILISYLLTHIDPILNTMNLCGKTETLMVPNDRLNNYDGLGWMVR